jgi:hypothetical protein
MAKLLADADFDWAGLDHNILIMTSTYAYSDAHDFRDDVDNEVSGTNYSAGGEPIDNKTASAANPSELTADDEVIAQSGAGFADGQEYAVTQLLGGAAGADPYICHGDAGAAFGNVAGQLTLDFPTNFIAISV